ncbi:5629_t:CDS:2 [Acaulospora colombiana]|uniref:5629_t:CDS:1 n=1 Tax=Acaulospora colombiana TaxID=27376 RepID=A0ACA9K9R5_9GLOM|nr:5629_t:CDS:2 [Acaulospora colombiana]
MLIVGNSGVLLIEEDWGEKEVVGEERLVEIIGECVFVNG